MRESIQRHGSTAEAHIGISETLRDKGDFAAADAELIFICRKFPDQPNAFRVRGEVLRLLGKSSEAIEIYLHMAEEFPFEYAGIRGHGETLRDQHRFEAAHAVFRKAISAFPGEAALRVRQASVYKEEGKLEQALQAMGDIARLFPNNYGAMLGTADLLKQLGRLEDAASRYRDLISSLPRSLEAKISLAAILVAQGRFEEAKEFLPTRGPRTQSDWVAEHIRGMILLKSGSLPEARSLFEKGCKTVPFYRQQRFFQKALALAKLRSHEFNVENDLGIVDDPISNVIRLHAYGARKDIPRAELALASLRNFCPPTVVPIRDELAAQLGLSKQRAIHDSGWLFREECNLLTVASTFRDAA